MTEDELWAVLVGFNAAHGGDHAEAPMLASGPRTNPCYQEASGRVIERGDLVAFDTDLLGPLGYCADLSRSWVVGAKPDPVQSDLLARAADEISHNVELLSAGASFAELSAHCFRHEPRFVAHRYVCAFHGVGMSDEYPKVPYPQDWDLWGFDGEVQPQMVLSVESFVGSDDGGPGVKLEQMVLVGSGGCEVLSDFALLQDAIT